MTESALLAVNELAPPPTEGLITPAYRDLNTVFHHQRADYGMNGVRHVGAVKQLAQAYDARSLLDYGCGKQTLIEALRLSWARGYDPCIPGLDGPPAPADLVACTDVLEHIEPECLEAVLDHLRSLTLKVLYATISLQPAKKTLPDGRNTHLIVQPAAWWLWRLLPRWEPDTIRCGKGEMVCVLRVPGEAPRSPKDIVNNIRL